MTTVSDNEAVFPPLVPVTVKFKGLGVLADRPVTVKVLLWPAVMTAGLNEQVAPDEQDREMLETKPLGADAETVKVADVVPTKILAERLVAESMSTAPPVPEREADCGLPEPLSVTRREPVRDPLDVGVKVTLTAQLAPGLRTLGAAPQLLVSAKSPLMLIAVRVIAVLLPLTS
jgi:hypothetical protein